MKEPDEMTDEEVHALFNGPAVRCSDKECERDFDDGEELAEPDFDDESGDLVEGTEVTVADVLAAHATSPRAASMLLAATGATCPDCYSTLVVVTVNHLDEFAKARVELDEIAAMIVERIPEMKDDVERMVAEADEHVARVLDRMGAS